MMESPEARPLAGAPWLFGRQGMGLLMFVTAVAATFLATDVAYLAGALMLVGFGARAWAALAFARVRYTRQPGHARAFNGDTLVLESTFSNPRLLPLPWLEIWEQLPAALQPEAVRERSFAQQDRVWVSRGLAVWPYQRLRWRRTLRCVRRGVYRLGEIRLRAGDPFGFFERERRLTDTREVMVYPAVVRLRRLSLPLHHPSLDMVSASSFVTDPTRTATIREYRPDDPQRLIHWASTAHRGSLQVRVLEPATSLHVTILLDVHGFSFGIYEDELLELALSAIASISVFLQGQGAPTAFVANTQVPIILPAAASVPHLQGLLESLARLRPAAGPSLLPWALDHLPRGNTVLLVAADIAPDLQRSIAHLEDAGFTVRLLLAGTDARRTLLTPGADLAAVLEGRP